MEPDTQTPVSVQHETAASSGTVIVPVQVGDEVNQVVLSYDNDALIAGDTTYIIQFVDEASAQATEAAASGESQLPASTQDSQDVQECQPDTEPTVSEQACSELVESSAEGIVLSKSSLTAETTDGLDAGAAITWKPPAKDGIVSRTDISRHDDSCDLEDNETENEEPKADFKKETQTRSKSVTKSKTVSESSGNSDNKIVSPDTDTTGSRRANRRSIKKPARFKDTETGNKKKQPEPKYIKIPAISRKSLGLRDLIIEVEIEEKLYVSSLEKSDSENGFCKYLFRISKNPIRIASEILSKSEDIISEPIHEIENIEDLESKEDNKEVTDKCDIKKQSVKPKNKPKVIRRTKRKKADEDKVSQQKKEITNDDGADGASPIETNYEEMEDPHDCMEELDNVVESDGILKADNKNRTDTPDKPKPKRKRKKKVEKTEKEEKSPDDQNNETKDKIDGEPKPKRKYVKRNAYNRDDQNYTIRKNEKGKDIYKCNFCGLELKYHGNMKDHTRIHTKETPFECAQCGKGFTNQSNYNHHLSVHTNERPFVCDVCNFGFKTKMAYKRHYRRHFGSATHTCDYCGKMFYSSTELQKHLVVHTGEKNYQCEYCPRRFNNDSSLIRHRYLHTGGGRHVCHTCGEKFIRKEYFRAHLLRAHNMELVEDYSTLPYRHRPKQGAITGGLYFENSEDLPLVKNEIEIATQEIQVILSDANSVSNNSE